MAITQVQAAQLSNDLLLRGVIQTIVKESPILSYLPFMELIGTSLTYNREDTLPNVNWYAPGDTWTEATPTFTQASARLTILGGDADVDNFLQNTYRDTNDIRAEVIASRAKATAYEFSNAFFNGDSMVNTKQFDGLDVLIPPSRTINAGAPPDEAMLDELIDMIIGKPDILVMSKRTRRQIKALRRADGISMETSLNEFGQQVVSYDGIPIITDDFILNNKGAGSDESTVYALRFGLEGIQGLQNGGIQIVNLGDLETKDASRDRIKWYCGSALINELGVAKLDGLTA